MLKNYLVITLRNLLRNKVYTAINLVGLAVGIASCLLIFLFLQHELSYDESFKDADRIYRVTSTVQKGDQTIETAAAIGPLAQLLPQEYPEVESATVLINMGQNAIRTDEQAFYTDNIIYADSNIFSVLDFPFIVGNPSTALKAPASIVLTSELAGKLFGSLEAALGKPVKYIASTFLVTGVIDQTAPSHINPGAILPLHFDAQTEYYVTDWNGIGGYTYLKLHKKEHAAPLQEKIADLYDRKATPGQSLAGITGATFQLQNITDAYLDKEKEAPVGEVGNITYIYIFGVIAGFLLLIASINYINLATARSAKRAKEVGMRKAIGASRAQVIQQFLLESVLLAIVASLLALMLVELTLPLFNTVTGKTIDSVLILSSELGMALLVIVLFIGIVAGSYPAFFLSRFSSAEVLKSNQTPKSGNALLRKGLVVAQFTISLVLITGTIVVYDQMMHVRNTDLGFDKEQVVAISIPSIGWVKQKENLAAIKQEFRRLPQVVLTTNAQQLPGEGAVKGDYLLEQNNRLVKKSINTISVGYEYLDLMGMKLSAGRNYSKDIRTDEQFRYILNEAAVKELGWSDAIDKRIKPTWADTANGTVIGVVKDFNYTSLHSKIEPLVIQLDPHFGKLVVRLEANTPLAATLSDMEDIWRKYFPGYPMDYSFLDESFHQQYQAEEKMLTIFTFFALLTIVIACMGLFGLASYMAEQRTKEIGIRKVLGGSVTDIVVLLTGNFATLVVIAIVLAVPVAWYAMDTWLQNFAYRTELSWWQFVAAGMGALAIALLTVSYQALKAATTDPVKALRAE
ncbi:ABC transporter permease [Pontibacter burrus]|uniref:FtsX-like permease family protein n=1 Tax=Pontibacter burrus TaxID=2704466 RepID=A0A6B3LJY6_9BACT|nr:ABC transporter permease [Pontibacter burrus]NEM97049.1 FtsX-like permease family protein [Pontibacter burrus]